MPGPLRRPLTLFLVLCGLCLAYFGFELHEWGHERAGRVAMLRDDLGSPRKSNLLRRLGLSARPIPSVLPTALVEAARQDLASLPPSPMRTVAIRIAEEDLYDPETGLQANSRERGRDWERPAGVAVALDGREILAAPAGVRLQGNRNTRDSLHSFRLYFRNSYGTKDVPGDAFLDGSHMDVRKVLARTEKNLVPGFVSMLAFDVARRLGATTPDYAPIRLFRNGLDLGLGLASEHVNRVHWERKLGHTNFVFYMLESENSVLDTAQYKALRLRLDPFFGLWDHAYVGEILDLDDFMTAMTAFAFLQWQDWNQGAFILDRTDPRPRWRSVLWDPDLAFAGLRPRGIPANRAGWKNFRDAHGMRAAVFKGMWDNSPRFREEMLHRLAWSVNHRLTKAWITERVGHYGRLEKASGLDCFDEDQAMSFLLERRKTLLDETVAELGAPALVTCRIHSPEPLLVDGETWSGDYDGWYFRGQRITAAPLHADAFSHWEIDGRRINGLRLEIDADADTSIRAVFQSAAD